MAGLDSELGEGTAGELGAAEDEDVHGGGYGGGWKKMQMKKIELVFGWIETVGILISGGLI